jgi:hypothetical protein
VATLHQTIRCAVLMKLSTTMVVSISQPWLNV